MTEDAEMKREAAPLRERASLWGRKTCPAPRLPEHVSNRYPPWGAGPWPVRHDRPRRWWRTIIAALHRSSARTSTRATSTTSIMSTATTAPTRPRQPPSCGVHLPAPFTRVAE